MMALIIAVAMVLGMTSMAFAAPVANEHTITITNTDQNVSHTYEAYQVFSGNLNADESLLSDIAWGTGVDGAGIITALKTTTDPLLASVKTAVASVNTADADAVAAAAYTVAKAISGFSSTTGGSDSAGAIDAFATIVAGNLGTKTADFTEGTGTNAGKYTADVTGDGYYFIKDTTTTLQDNDTTASDTLSKYLLAVIKDTTIVAKDTGLTPDKKIDDGSAKVKADTAAIGDTVNFEVTVVVPNTKKYEDHFWFVMDDTLPAGITFTGIKSVEINGTAVNDTAKATPSAPDLRDPDPATGTVYYNGTAGWYTLKVDDATPTFDATETTKYTFEASTYDAVAAAGGQSIKLTFNQFKKFVETNNLIGQTITIKYTGVVNDDAQYKATENENEVVFEYSNTPNHDYDGDTPDNDSVTGKTPESKTRTYTTSLKIKKVDENNQPLAGATFELKGDALNRTVLTGDKFELTTYTAKDGETIDNSKKYWKLLDGSFTATDPATVTNKTQYVSEGDPATYPEYYKVTYSFSELTAQSTDIVLVTNAQGIAEFVGLNEGDYTLEEIAAPDGYNKIDGKANIAVAWSDPKATDATSPAKDQGGYTFTVTGNAEFGDDIAWNATDKQFEVTIKNLKGTTLPSTGGIGTTIFYVVGAILVIGAGVVLITRRRMDA